MFNYPYYPMQYGMPQEPQKPAQSGPDWIQVSSVQQVEQVPVQPDAKAWVMVQNEPVFALRSADQVGLITTSYYRFEKYNPTESKPTPEYVTRAEFEQFVASLKEEEKK